MEKEKGKNNPYYDRISDFPERIFPGIGRDVDVESFRKSISSYDNLILEIGSGSGMHLIELAKQNPLSAVIGLEIRYKRSVRTIEKSNDQGVLNTFVVQMDARKLIDLFEENSISCVYINFPDPWPKKKQRKNRIVSNEFLDLLNKILAKDGKLYFKTDHREYFNSVMSDVIPKSSFKVLEETRDLYRSEFLEGNIKTEFENLFLKNGEEINYACFIKKN